MALMKVGSDQPPAWLMNTKTESDPTALSEISHVAEKLYQLQLEWEKAQVKADELKEKYDAFRYREAPDLFKMHGLSSITLSNGAKVEIVSKYYCSPNKNPMDRQTISNWLREVHGDHLIHEQLVVPTIDNNPDTLNAVRKMIEEYNAKQHEEGKQEVLYLEETEVNTNSLKAWLKSQVGANGGTAIIDIDTIPECIHFLKREECEVH